MSTKKTEYKVCPRCGRSLPRSAFSQNLYQSGERQGYCKSCCRAQYKEHKAKIKAFYGELPWYLKSR